MKSIFPWLVVSIILCCMVTGLSYVGGIAYDGATTMGFPFTFYRHSVGMSVTTYQMEDHFHFYWLALTADITLTFGVVFFLRWLYKFFRQ